MRTLFLILAFILLAASGVVNASDRMDEVLTLKSFEKLANKRDKNRQCVLVAMNLAGLRFANKSVNPLLSSTNELTVVEKFVWDDGKGDVYIKALKIPEVLASSFDKKIDIDWRLDKSNNFVLYARRLNPEEWTKRLILSVNASTEKPYGKPSEKEEADLFIQQTDRCLFTGEYAVLRLTEAGAVLAEASETHAESGWKATCTVVLPSSTLAKHPKLAEGDTVAIFAPVKEHTVAKDDAAKTIALTASLDLKDAVLKKK